MKKHVTQVILSLVLITATGYLYLSGNKVVDNREPLSITEITAFNSEEVFKLNEESFLCDFDNYLMQQHERYNTPGFAVAIVKKGEVIYQKGFGYRDLSSKLPVTPHTVFRIGSVSKGISAGLAGILENENRFSWKDPISKFIPDFTTNKKQWTDSLTVERILSHTTGYPYQAYTTLIEDGLPLNDMINSLKKLPLSRHPGEIHAYQNVAYSLIEKVAEASTETPFDSLMKEKIFNPLGMTNASTDYHSIVSASNFAKPHFATRRGYYVSKVSPTYYNAAAAGGVNASISDMGKWLVAAMGYRPDVLPYEVRKELFNPRTRIRVKNHYLSRLDYPRFGHYGLGWRILDYPTETIIYHEGYVNGYKSAIGFSQTNDIGICILANAGGSLTSKALAEFFKMYEESQPPVLHASTN